MKREMDCIGFSAPEGMVQFMSEQLSKIQHISPYDSYVDATVERKSNDYIVTFLVKHAHGKFSTQHRGADLTQVIIQAVDAVAHQVRLWWKERFQNN